MFGGKTQRKRESGAPQRNLANKAERAAWQNDSSATNATFPRHTCNGKRNRSVTVMKKNGKMSKK